MKHDRELIRLFAINEVADDLESFAKIVERVTVLSARYQSECDYGTISGSLQSLLEDGLVDAYKLDPFAKNTLVPNPIKEQFAELFFTLSDKGQEVHEATVWEWPPEKI